MHLKCPNLTCKRLPPRLAEASRRGRSKAFPHDRLFHPDWNGVFLIVTQPFEGEGRKEGTFRGEKGRIVG
jgi:hypothetical protein